jgi:hypothetical protein
MRHLLAYALFVGAPLAGLLGVLRLGQSLEAPRAVHGTYSIQPMARSGRPCLAYLLSGGDSTVKVSQSGRQVTLTLGPDGDVSLRGTLTNGDLALRGVILPGATPRQAACPVGDTLRLTARAGIEPHVRRLDAELRLAGCPECDAVGFSAVTSLLHLRRPRG